MKKIFETPEIEIMLLGAQDVITTSDAFGQSNYNSENGNDEADDW